VLLSRGLEVREEGGSVLLGNAVNAGKNTNRNIKAENF
jgi:hypothetical protein